MVPAADEPDLSAPELDQRATDVRNAAVMSVGTLLSRATGVVRVSVTLAALGTTNVVANSYAIANTTPNIVYELILGGILTSVFVPLLVDWAKRYGEDEGRIAGARFLTFVLVVLSAVTLVAIVFAPWIMRLYLIGREGSGRPRRPARARHVLPAVVPAPDRVLRGRRGGGRDLDRQPPVRGADVRAGAQQHRGDRDDARVHRDARQGPDDAR